MSHIFISYSKKETFGLASRLYAYLTALPNTTAWMDTDLKPAYSWPRQIQAQIDRSDVVIVLLSPDVNRPETPTQHLSFVVNEIAYARQRHKSILPMMAIATESPVELAGIEYIDLIQNESAGFQRLKTWLDGHVRPTPPLATAPIPATTPIPKINRRNPSLALLGAVAAVVIIGFLFVLVLSQASRGMSPTASPTADTVMIAVQGTYSAQTKTAVASIPTPDTEKTIAAIVANTDATYTAIAKVAATPLPPTPAPATRVPPTASLVNSISVITANAQWKSVVQSFDGVEMVLVPAGCFMMGSENGDSDEKPVTKICFDAPFYIDKTEVTQAQFAKFGGAAKTQPSFSGEQRPVENITWLESRDYCAKRGARLPMESEWEYAARGPDNLVYPWGNDFVGDNVVYSGNSGSQTANVGSKAAGVSWVGALDLSGNVWEWVSSIYKPYPYDAKDGRESISNTNSERVLRGGSWNDKLTLGFRAAYRDGVGPSNRYSLIGFRCARS